MIKIENEDAADTKSKKYKMHSIEVKRKCLEYVSILNVFILHFPIFIIISRNIYHWKKYARFSQFRLRA